MIPLPPPLSGDHPLAPWLNRLRDCVQQAQVTDVQNGILWHGAQGTQIVCAGRGGGGAQVSRYKLKEVQGDYLQCKTWDGTTEGTVTINIAKPFRLRESVTTETKLGVVHTYSYAAGTTVPNNRVRTDSWATNTEQQWVAPPWLADENILAISGIDTGVSVSSANLDLMMVCDSRQWASEYD